jgi:ribose 5-phosphate isomerase A
MDDASITVSVNAHPLAISEALLRALGLGGGMNSQDELKRQAAEAAVAEVENGMVLGLGSGSTAELALQTLAVRVAAGLQISGVPTSERTAALARCLGIPLTDFSAQSRLDLTLDGADEVEPASLSLVKGRGGALLREKIVAAASRRMLIMVDVSKLVPRLGRGLVPVEVVAFGWQATLMHLQEAGIKPELRRTPKGAPILTDSGNHIADCSLGPIDDPALLNSRLRKVAGVVETGLFLGLATRVIVAAADGIRLIERP